jgi:hypothetical protein
MQLHAYKGYFENGHFYTAGQTMRIPERLEITVLFERPPHHATQPDRKKIDERLAIVQSLKGIIPPDVDLETVRAERIAQRGL